MLALRIGACRPVLWVVMGRRVLTVGLVGGAVLTVFAAPADGKWSKTFTVTSRCGCVEAPLVASSARYGSTVVWVRNATLPGGDAAGEIWARRIRRDGSLAPKRKLGSHILYTDHGESIASGRSGAIVVAWQSGDGSVHARRISPRGKIGRVRRISTTGGDSHEVHVAVDPRGNAVIAWSGIVSISSQGSAPPVPPNVHVRRLSARGDLGRTISLHPQSTYHEHPRVALAPSGRAIVTWNAGPIQAAMVERDGTVGPLLAVSPEFAGGGAELAVDSQGTATAVWQSQLPAKVKLRRISSTGALGPVYVPVPGDSEQRGGLIGLDRGGNAIVAWGAKAPAFRAPTAIESWRLGRDNSIGAVTNLSPPGVAPWDTGDSPVALAVDRNGYVTLAWIRSTGTGDSVRFAALARRAAPDDALGPVRTLAGPSSLSEPALGVDARGVVTAAWNTGVDDPATGRAATIKAARFVPRR